MTERLVALIVDESKWLPLSMGLALLVVSVLQARHRRAATDPRRRVLVAMNLFFGVTIGTMAFGHLLAVTTKLAIGTLEGSLLVFYLIGISLAVPSWWLIVHSSRLQTALAAPGRTTLSLNAWLGITLMVLGPQNLPLVAPAALNIGYQLHSRRVVGWLIAGIAVVINLGLFIGSLIFMASGQSFEQFSGTE